MTGVQTCALPIWNDLLARRTAFDHWKGRLSSSALSTAVAAFALAMADSEAYATLIDGGLRWLCEKQNEDGGWGDTVDSPSNLSTTLLCYSAMAVSGVSTDCSKAVDAAQEWLGKTAGSLEPKALASAVDDLYGKDKTFSAPILTMCALAGRLGDTERAWRLVRPLPFELAVFPQQFYKSLRLPVVSYALPALIAIGQVHFAHQRVGNPIKAAARRLSRSRSLDVLARIQPENGGFLEAAPLTGFVVMSLCASGLAEHTVVRKGVDFLVQSVRDDGSWPIDTNLATWVTSLSVNALAAGDIETALSIEDRQGISNWLLASQQNERHPYTAADPRGWAWSNLSGAVPDADDTAGALLALCNLGIEDNRTIQAAAKAIEWLTSLQNRDGGIPTFCRGWTSLPFDKSTPDITAHGLGAMGKWLAKLSAHLSKRTERSITRAMDYLRRVQREDGSWIPLWFGNQMSQDQHNPVYGTARVLTNIAHMPRAYVEAFAGESTAGACWLLAAQNTDGGWGGDVGIESTIEESALAVDALATLLLIQKEESPPATSTPTHKDISTSLVRGTAWLVTHTQEGTYFPASPIGLYFASLWYCEELYPLVFTLSALMKARSALADSE